MGIFDDAEAKARARDREVEDQKKKEADEREKKNDNFTQVYHKYWRFMSEIINDNPKAAILYNFLAEHAAPDTGAVVVSQQILADHLNVSRMTISRHIKYLESKHVVLKITLSGGVCAYALDPEMIWKSWSTNKRYATFKTQTLVKKIDLEKNEIHRKLNVMMKEQKKKIDENDESLQTDIEDYIEKMNKESSSEE